MNTKEKALWYMMKDWAGRNLTEASGYKCHLQRIESEMTSRGISDVCGCLNGKSAWIELKIIHGKDVGLKPEQVNWIKKRIWANDNCWILARRIDIDYDELWLWHGSKVQEVFDKGTLVEPDLKLRRFAKNKPFSWEYIFCKIFKCYWLTGLSTNIFLEHIPDTCNEVIHSNKS